MGMLIIGRDILYMLFKNRELLRRRPLRAIKLRYFVLSLHYGVSLVFIICHGRKQTNKQQ